MTYPKKLFGLYRERPPDSRCCEHCLMSDCCIGREETVEILSVGTDAGKMARIRIGGRIIEVPLTEIHFKEETE